GGNMKILYSVAIAMLIALPYYSFADEAPSGAGTITYVKGTAQKKGTKGEDWERAKENTTLTSGDKVKTLEKTRAEIRLEAGKVIRLDENTTVDLVKLVEESQNKVETDIKIEQGNLWAKVGKLGENTELKVESPIAGASIRGTTFRVEVAIDKSTQLNVYEGVVEIYNPMQKTKGPITRIEAPREVKKPGYIEGPKEVSLDEWTYIVKDMQRFTITPAGIKKVEEFKKDDTEEQSDWVKWNMEMDKKMDKKGNMP
ncbi:MAG: putative periplasmic protein, partial [Deltaproteobacteria bacterium]|nr:putative periplasmic protein [Deltaproteobacteria bacterium]